MANRGLVVLVIVLVLALVGAIGYIGYEKYSASQLTEQQQIYYGGANDAYLYLSSQLAQCPPQGVEIPAGDNQSLHVVALECYAQGQ